MKWDLEDVKPCVVLNSKGEESTPEEPPVDPPPTGDCSDPAYAAAHPDECRKSEWLEVRPSSVSIGQYDSVQFTAVLHSGDEEIAIHNDTDSGIEWNSSDYNIAVIGATGGSATAVGEGLVTVTATYHNLQAFAQLQAMAVGEDCTQKAVHVMVAIDSSKSMGYDFGAVGYGTKLTYAKALASRFIGELNLEKDSCGLVYYTDSDYSFGNAVTTIQLGATNADMQSAISAMQPCTQKGSQLDWLIKSASEHLGGGDINVLLLISDGWTDEISNGTVQNYIAALDGKNIVVIVVAVRTWGVAYENLLKFASGGFFLSATASTADATSNYLSGLKGYLCLGNCIPEGDRYSYRPALNMDDLTQWDVSGKIDLIGCGSDGVTMFDLLPGNGMYLDMAGSSSPWLGMISTKSNILLEAANDYTLTLRIAGNQRKEGTGYKVKVWLQNVATGEHINEVEYDINDWKQDFSEYTLDTIFGDGGEYKIFIQQSGQADDPAYGNLLGSVELRNLTTDAQIFYDNFNSENKLYISPRCPNDLTEAPVGGADLINISLYNPDDAGSLKEGPAAVGNAGDVWNKVEVTTFSAGFGINANLVNALGDASGVVLSANGIGDEHGITGAADAMMNRYVNSGKGLGEDHQLDIIDMSDELVQGSGYILLSGLESGWYDVYVYGFDGQTYGCIASVANWTGQPVTLYKTIGPAGVIDDPWEEGEHYVAWKGVKADQRINALGTGQPTSPGICILFRANPPAMGGTRISGIQLLRQNTPDGPPVPTSQYDRCKGSGCLSSPPPEQHPSTLEIVPVE